MNSAANPLDDPSSAYAQQVRAGFHRLRFVPELEEEFKSYYLGIHVNRVRFSLPLAVVITLLFMLTDHIRLPIEIAGETYLARIAQLSSLAVLWAVLHLDWRQHLEKSVSMVLLVYGFSVPVILGYLNSSNFTSPIHAMSVLIIFCYFMAGLRFRHAALLAFCITIPYPLSQLLFEVPFPNLILNTFFLLVFNALGLGGAWFIEYTARENFLNRQMLSELAMHDSLTALPNRRSLFIDLGRLSRQARRDQVAFAIAMVDVDHFKAYNDQFGHMSGDVCLQKLAEVLNQAAQRPLDTTGRYGGEEFTLIWYDCSPAQAKELAEKLRQDIEALNITQADKVDTGVITVSVGVCLCPVGGVYTEEMVIKRADEALYQAKDDGRNRVVMHEMRSVDSSSA